MIHILPTALEMIADCYRQRQLVLVAWDGETTQVVTWGQSTSDSASAAKGGNFVKTALGWPENLNSESPRVEALQKRIAELEARLQAFEAKPTEVHVIEGTEHERGWGQRPDGYVAFSSEVAARKYIVEYDRKWNSASSAPDEYTKYEYIGVKPCSQQFFDVIESYGSDGRHVHKLQELLE